MRLKKKKKLELNKIYNMDCLEGMRLLGDNSVDSIVTDPPYELGFMGKSWDSTGIAYSVEIWKEALRVLKPGGHLLSFGGTRTYHRMACAIEDAGFEIRDQIQWIYGSGFPKSMDISKAIDKAAGDTEDVQQWQGYGTALKPANEPIVLARKPLSEKTIVANVLRWDTGGLNIDGCRIETKDNLNGGAYSREKKSDGQWGTMHNFVGKEYKQPQGRFPANVIFDEKAGAILDKQSGTLKSGKMKAKTKRQNLKGWAGDMPKETANETIGDSGGAARFFYCAKASKADRGIGNTHPTVKPLKLMEHLVTLVTPGNGLVLDPFTGSGSTLLAASKLGFNFIGFELDKGYYDIVNQRITSALKGESVIDKI